MLRSSSYTASWFVAIVILTSSGQMITMCHGKYFTYQRPVSCSCNSTASTLPSGDNATNEGQEEGYDYQILMIGGCISLDESSCHVTTGGCPYDLHESHWMKEHTTGIYTLTIKRNHSCSKVNPAVCGAIHRTGLLCSQCQQEYGLAIYSRTWDCHPCPTNLPNAASWTIYLMLELLPLTVFFLIAVATDLQAIKPPFSAYIFYCQFFAILIRSSSHIRMHLKKHSFAPLHVITLSAIDLWNLDFLRRIIPRFCLSPSLGNFDSILLDFCCGLLPLVLVAGVYLAIELHARDTKVIVLLWRPFHSCLAGWRRTWNPQASMTNVFITFLVLSMSKLMTISMYSMFTVNAFQSFPTGSHKKTISNILYLDPSKKLSDIPTVALTTALSMFFLVLLPMTLNIMYPLKCLRRWRCLEWFCNSHHLTHFMDAWQGHFKNSATAGARCDYRHASVLFFVHRLFTLQVVAYTVIRMETVFDNTVLFVDVLYLGGMAIFYALVRPYTDTAANVIESLLFGLAGAVLLVTVCIPVAITPPHRNNLEIHANVVLLGIALPTAVLAVHTVKWLVIKLVRIMCRSQERRRRGSDGEEAWHRLDHPDDYTPLLIQDRPAGPLYT